MYRGKRGIALTTAARVCHVLISSGLKCNQEKTISFLTLFNRDLRCAARFAAAGQATSDKLCVALAV